ncbi:MAG: ribbon-helix-helix protein, CopG family, partial [Mycobacteriales bacterium]
MTVHIADRGVALIQARVSRLEAEQLEADARTLGLPNRSEAMRRAIALLHQQAREAELSQSYDEYYGGQQTPVSDVSALGDV